VDGFNPVNQVPDAGSMARAIESRFTVVSDAFMTDTALRADLILPCALGPEYENIVGSCLHNHAQHGAKLFEPPGQARPDLDILADLGRRLDPPVGMPGSEEILRASLDSPLLDLDLETMREKGFARAKVEPVTFSGLKFGHADGKFRFADRLDPEPPPEPGFPLKLLSLVNRDYIHSQIPEERQQDRPTAFVSPESPSLEGIDPDQPVFLASPLGRIRVELGFDQSLHPMAVIVRRGHWHKNNRGLNLLVSPKTTDMGGGSAYYSQDVRLEN